MNTTLKLILTSFVILLFSTACKEKVQQNHEQVSEATQQHLKEEEHKEGLVSLTAMQRKAIGLTLGHLSSKNLSSDVMVTGELEVPPQSEASVSSLIGGNVYEIFVIEGDKVRKGQTLVLLQNPDIVQMQVDLQAKSSTLSFFKNKYQRQQNLYEKNVGSGKELQKAKAEYISTKAQVEGLKAKMEIFHLDPQKIIGGKIYRYIPIIAPIRGFVKDVNINIGQYVTPEETLFGIVNNTDIHADLMVFEKDVYKVHEGQKVQLAIANKFNKSYQAEIFSVGKTFEEDPKAVHIHAEIIGSTEGLIPGMYVEGKINVNNHTVLALPESAIIREGEKQYIFVKIDESENTEEVQSEKTKQQNPRVFKMIQVTTGVRDQGWVEVKLFHALKDSTEIVYQGAYKLISEMQKSETSHHH